MTGIAAFASEGFTARFLQTQRGKDYPGWKEPGRNNHRSKYLLSMHVSTCNL